MAKVTKNQQISTKVNLVTFSFVQPQSVQFIPGQFVSLEVGPNTYRSYSICSDYKDTQALSIIVAIAHDGVGANYIKNLRTGDLVNFIGPSGRYFLREPLPAHLYFFATGTGISPYITFLHYLEDIKYAGEISLYFGVRNEEELLLLQELEKFKNTLNFNFEIFLSQEGRRVTMAATEACASNAGSALYYLCGNPFMIVDVANLLISHKVPSAQIIIEKFTYSHN